jgi:microcystin degradation protein MlrC
MGFRLAVGGIAHESNTFCNPTPLSSFRQNRGEEILAAHRGVRTYIGGMLDGADEVGAEVVPTYDAEAEPSGTIRREALAEMIRQLADAVAAARPDAVALALHGAGVAEGCDDVETEVLRAVRAAVGPRVPIAASLDLHGNLRAEMLEYATALFGVKLYPHADSYERGVEVVRCLAGCVRGELHPVMALERLPLLLFSCSSDVEPVKSVNEYCSGWEERPGVLAVRFFHGFCHTDIPEMGATVLAVADGDLALAQAAAADVARHIWSRRAEFTQDNPDAATAVREAAAWAAANGGPVVVNDTADNPGGGGPGDGTHVLRALIEARVPRAAFAYIYDPQTAAAVHAAGAGAVVDVRLGGRTYPINGDPLVGRAYVKSLTDGRFVLSTPMGRGKRVDLGPMARLRMMPAGSAGTGEPAGVDVLVGSGRTQVFDDEMFLLHGIDVRRYDVVVVKSANHFRAGFRDIARRIVTADSGGITTGNLRTLPYRRMRRPIYPLDPDAAYAGSS